MSYQGKALGSYGEDVAARHLVEQGMVVLDRNWRCEHGELDLVLRDGDTLVVCEVKTRRSERFGHPLESVTAAKAERLRGLTELWMHTRGLRPPQVRIDIVGVLLDGPGAGRVSHLRGVG